MIFFFPFLFQQREMWCKHLKSVKIIPQSLNIKVIKLHKFKNEQIKLVSQTEKLLVYTKTRPKRKKPN